LIRRYLACLLVVAGCGDASKQAEELAARASAGRTARSAGEAQLDKGISAAKKALFGLTDSGALSESASAWLTSNAPTEGSAESLVAKGVQVAPVAVEIAKVANRAVDEETAIEPVYQKIEPGGEAKLDESIKAMPRVELVNGTTVGFKKLDSIENAKITKEQAVLVLWRKGDHLVGFLYRSKRTIDLELVIKETPRLYALTNAAIK
jgi:uncharacterized protein YfiM (DUF2279 family)